MTRFLVPTNYGDLLVEAESPEAATVTIDGLGAGITRTGEAEPWVDREHKVRAGLGTNTTGRRHGNMGDEFESFGRWLASLTPITPEEEAARDAAEHQARVVQLTQEAAPPKFTYRLPDGQRAACIEETYLEGGGGAEALRRALEWLSEQVKR